MSSGATGSQSDDRLGVNREQRARRARSQFTSTIQILHSPERQQTWRIRQGAHEKTQAIGARTTRYTRFSAEVY